MSFNLWKYFIEDDIDGFRQFLAGVTYAHGSSKIATGSVLGTSFKIGSPAGLATSPRTPVKPRRIAGNIQHSSSGRSSGIVVTRAEINSRDNFGRTILHHAASSRSVTASEFVKCLLEIPTLDLYIQDAENGWTALHRALYAGNVGTAQMLLARDFLNVIEISNQPRTQVGGLVKIKDHEGNSPFEVFEMTIAPRVLTASPTTSSDVITEGETDDEEGSNNMQDLDRATRQTGVRIDLAGDEVFAFGSNKNFSLGLGDEDDRQFPERVNLKRPEHVMWRLYEDYKRQKRTQSTAEDLTESTASLMLTEGLPAIIRHKPIKIQGMIMSKLHTAILTDDPVANLHICGFGPGGRLGTGDEATQFGFVCVQGGGLASRRVAHIALGQDHSIAICSSGEVFTWGNNKFGQLGYVLPESTPKRDPVQLTPRQLYGLVKKEAIVGAAASSIHSVIYTTSGLYTFGKNEGQLGLMDADARSLKIQNIPRRVGVLLIQSAIRAVSAIERATSVLLENRDVLVFTHYGFTKVVFPLEDSSIFLPQALSTRYNKEVNMICKITGAGNTIGALSTFGQVFTVDVPKVQESVPSNVSTTNPNKARNALPTPSTVWTIRKAHMAATDVAVGQDGSVVLCTQAGAVWRKEKRANIKSVHDIGEDSHRPKDYKFVRVPYLTRAVAVRSNAFGAFGTVSRDCDVTRDQIDVASPSLLNDLFPHLAFREYGTSKSPQTDEASAAPELRFWLPSRKSPSVMAIKAAILKGDSIETDFEAMARNFEPLNETEYDVWITSTATKIRIPVHSTILRCRSHVLRESLAGFPQKYYHTIPEVVSIEYAQRGEVEIKFHGADVLTLVNLVLYLYTDCVIDFWHYTSTALHLASRYRQIRIELMKIASSIGLVQLEKAVRVMIDPTPSLMEDFESAFVDADFFTNADVVIDLSNGEERRAHSLILSSRCPFFEGLFHGRAAGMWLSSRKNVSDGVPELTHVDLKHVDAKTFDSVLRHIYADTGVELFDTTISRDLDDFIDTVIEVMSVANEIMLDRLVQICQYTIGQYVNQRNICGLLNVIAETSVPGFKDVALEYLCLNLEGLLGQRQLAELEQYLIEELDEVVKDNQLAFMPFVRSDKAQAELLESHLQLAEFMEQSRQRRIDAMRLQSRYVADEERPTPKARVGSYDKLGSSPVSIRKMDVRLPPQRSPRQSPAITPNDAGEDLPFDMDEDATTHLEGPSNIFGSVFPQLSTQKSITTLSESRVRKSGQSPSLQSPLPVTMNLASPTNVPVSESLVTGFEINKSAWKSPAVQEKSLGLKQIMDQTSSSQISGLTKAVRGAETPKAAAHKMSQKERKRQIQQQHQLQDTSKSSQHHDDHNKPQSSALGSVSNVNSAGPPSSPWKKVVPVNRPGLTSTVSETATSTVVASKVDSLDDLVNRRIPNSPHLEKNSQGKGKRSVSGPIPQQTATQSFPQIQSVRHIPSATRSTSYIDARTSMADILSQQQGEKLAIKEAVAKRSLQDIQQEQEFQEWWDQESRRVQEEEHARAAQNAKSSRSKSDRRKINRPKSFIPIATKETSSMAEIEQGQSLVHNDNQATHAISEQSTQGQSQNRSRNRGRGRGGGGGGGVDRGIGGGGGRGQGKPRQHAEANKTTQARS